MPHTLTATPVAAFLKKETEKNHQESESLLSPKLVSIKDSGSYAAILYTFYGFFHPLEIEISKLIDPSILPDISERRNASLILKDLSSLHFDRAHIPVCNTLPPLTTIPQALGALYVMEGSTLGGRMIMKMLMKNPAFPVPEDQLNFFAGYGADTGKKWIAFQELINSFAADANELVTSANLVFEAFSKWIKNTLYNGPEN